MGRDPKLNTNIFQVNNTAMLNVGKLAELPQIIPRYIYISYKLFKLKTKKLCIHIDV